MAKKYNTKKDTAKKETVERVVLKPILGIPPPLYMVVGTGVLVSMLLFAILVLPSILNNGSIATIASSPGRAAVFINHQYVGHTPLDIFVSKGRHTVSMVRHGFYSSNQEVEFPGRPIARIIFPKRVTHSVALASSHTPVEHSLYGLATFAEWSLATSQSEYPRPPLLVDIVHDLIAMDAFEPAEAFLVQSLRDIRDREALLDWVRAVAQVTGQEVHDPSNVSLVELASTLPLPAPVLPQLALLQSILHEEEPPLPDAPRNPTTEDVPSLEYTTRAGIEFVRMPQGSFVMGDSLSNNDLFHPAHSLLVSSFYISRTEVTRAQFAQFLQANSNWRPENRSSLKDQQLIDNNYLLNWSEDLPNHPVTFVSWHAAHAYAQWLQEQPAMNDVTVRLPYEYEWEYAAWVSGANRYDGVFRGPDTATVLAVADPSAHQGLTTPVLYDMLGNVWEWMENWYHPAQYLWGWEDPPFGDIGAHKSVRGGSWVNTRSAIDSTVRGHQPPAVASAYLGFRLVLSPKTQ